MSQKSGTAELKLTFPLWAPSDPLPPPPNAPFPAEQSGSSCLNKANRSRILRRERRAAARSDAAEKAAAAEKVAEEKAAAEMVFAEKAATAEKIAEADTETVGEKCLFGETDTVASTSCIATKCLNCEAEMSAAHQCEVPPTPPPIACKVVKEQLPPPLPLCHYCCHRGSGDNPVHFYLQCLCMDKKCSCRCYCSVEQLKLRKQVYPDGYSDGNPVDPSDKPQAQAIAETRADHRPCGSETCVEPV